jgi:hypothetical protein
MLPPFVNITVSEVAGRALRCGQTLLVGTRNRSMAHVQSTTTAPETQVTSSVLPVLVPAQRDSYDDPAAPVLDDFLGDLAVAYAVGPPFGKRFVSWRDLDRSGNARRALRRDAARNLDARLDAMRVHGQPPALMLGFEGLASSLLLAEAPWPALEAAVPGELVVGVPARDVVILTGSQSPPGLAKVRRAVDRVFFAGDRHLLTRHLLVRRRGVWVLLRPQAAGSAPEPPPYEPAVPARAPIRRGMPSQRSAGRPFRGSLSPYGDEPSGNVSAARWHNARAAGAKG